MDSTKFEEMEFEKIVIDWKGKGSKQISLFPGKENQIIRIPFQKGAKENDKIVVTKISAILAKDSDNDEFGQPYLPVKLIGEVVGNGKNKKIVGMKYKAKKRTKKTWGYREQYTKVKIIGMES